MERRVNLKRFVLTVLIGSLGGVLVGNVALVLGAGHDPSLGLGFVAGLAFAYFALREWVIVEGPHPRGPATRGEHPPGIRG